MRHTEESWRASLESTFGLRPCETGAAGSVSGVPLGRAVAFRVTGGPQRLRHTRPGPELLKVCIQRRGRATVRQRGIDVTVEPGELVVYDTGRSYDIALSGAWDCAVLTVPREALRLRDAEVNGLLLQPVSASVCGTAVLERLVVDAVRAGAQVAAPDRLGEACLALVAGLVTPVVESADDVARERVLAYVRAHLSNPGLSTAQVAAAHGMSVRSLQRLFEGRESVSEVVRELRLLGLRDDLRSPVEAHRAVMAVASRWGFVDQAHVTRVFRERFGVTPARYRREAALS